MKVMLFKIVKLPCDLVILESINNVKTKYI